MTTKQIKRAEALREIGAIRERLQVLKEQMEPLSFGLAQQVNICLHSLRTFEGQSKQHYRHDQELP